jgi:hypothetical protein
MEKKNRMAFFVIPSEISKFKDRAKIKFVVKPVSVLGSFIALHYLVPKNEMKGFKHRIPKKQVWVRSDIWNGTHKNALIRHELYELMMMIENGYSYREAHRVAEIMDGAW